MRAFNMLLRRWISPAFAGFHAAAAAQVGPSNLPMFCWLLFAAVLLMASTLPFERWLVDRRTAGRKPAKPEPQPRQQPAVI